MPLSYTSAQPNLICEIFEGKVKKITREKNNNNNSTQQNKTDLKLEKFPASTKSGSELNVLKQQYLLSFQLFTIFIRKCMRYDAFDVFLFCVVCCYFFLFFVFLLYGRRSYLFARIFTRNSFLFLRRF